MSAQCGEIGPHLGSPLQIWNVSLVSRLVKQEWLSLGQRLSCGPEDYSTAGLILGDATVSSQRVEIISSSNWGPVFLEWPDHLRIASFYELNGLSSRYMDRQRGENVIAFLREVFQCIRGVRPAYECLTHLVRMIQLLQEKSSTEDTSYSHPGLPFSIFLSIPENNSPDVVIRVAESIIHEVMHLYLTLIEKSVDLVRDGNAQFYSPWRGQDRSIRGVLHGAFVFRAVFDFLHGVTKSLTTESQVQHCRDRQVEIRSQLEQISDFPSCTGLTVTGAELARALVTIR